MLSGIAIWAALAALIRLKALLARTERERTVLARLDEDVLKAGESYNFV